GVVLSCVPGYHRPQGAGDGSPAPAEPDPSVTDVSERLLPLTPVYTGRGVGGEGESQAPSPPTPLPRLQGRGKKRRPGMSERTVVGLSPWLPWPLSARRWWPEPVRAERLAALRIGLAAVLLLDVLFSHLPHVHDFFGPNSLSGPEPDAWLAAAPRWYWS